MERGTDMDITYRPKGGTPRAPLPRWIAPERLVELYEHGKPEVKLEIRENYGRTIDFEATLKRNR